MNGWPRKAVVIDWPLVEALVDVPCAVADAAIALDISDSTLRRAINAGRPDLVLRFAAAQAQLRADYSSGQPADRMRERCLRIAEIVAAHRGTAK